MFVKKKLHVIPVHSEVKSLTEIKDRYNEKGPLREGIKFYVDYLGSTLVDELEEGQSYGNKISAKAVKTIHDMVSW